MLRFFSQVVSLVSDGWFCAGPSPVYQHHHHSRPYAHIPSSPYDRFGIRSRRPAPYPNPYHKRTDLPTQGKNNLNDLLAIVWTPHPRNIKLLPAGISNPNIYSSNVNFVSIWKAAFDRNFTLVIIFLDVKCLVSTNRFLL